MTDTALTRDYYAPHVRAEMAAALKRDDPEWEKNTPIHEFRKNFKFSSNSTKDIDALVSLGKGIATAKDSCELLSAVGRLLQGTADKLDEPA
jgi:hypothetical protein